jgi:hypothetical protein
VKGKDPEGISRRRGGSYLVLSQGSLPLRVVWSVCLCCPGGGGREGPGGREGEIQKGREGVRAGRKREGNINWSRAKGSW